MRIALLPAVERVRAMRQAQGLPGAIDATEVTRLALLLAPVATKTRRAA